MPQPEAEPGLVRDCLTLLELKDQLAGTAKLNWSETLPITSWHGIHLNDRGRVTGIFLHRRGLTGQIPPELVELTSLQILDLSHSQLTGSIPRELSGLTELRELYLNVNQLTGDIPAELGMLTNLVRLDLSENQLSGDIPAELANLQHLRVLHLHINQLSGNIPSLLGSMSSLEALTLHINQLTGNIPPELGDLADLRELRLYFNRLTGEIPSGLGKLIDLEILELYRNQLVGNIPPELGRLTSLRILTLDHNNLTGEVPTELSELTNLEALNLNRNDLDGCVPDNLRDAHPDLWTLSFCGDGPPYWQPVPIFNGGVDLVATYIERLPRYEKYKISYHHENHRCPYPFDEPQGPIVCPDQSGIKRLPAPGDSVQLIAHVSNFGDTPSGPFNYSWTLDNDVVESGNDEGLAPGESIELVLPIDWPTSETNPVVRFTVDPEDHVDELIEDNNSVIDWIKGHTLGIYFSSIAYESLTLSNQQGKSIQSPEHWVHNNVSYLNELLASAGLEDRVRTELFLIADRRNLDGNHPLRWQLDGWWGIWDGGFFTAEGYRERPEIDHGLLHELMHQLGAIDIYAMHLNKESVALPDINRPGELVGCNRPELWGHPWGCFRFPKDVEDMMSTVPAFIGVHTAGGMRSNAGHRRGYFGDYLFDTPETTVLRIVDQRGMPLQDVALHFYQRTQSPQGGIVDDIPEFTLTTNDDGQVVLPNRGIYGIPTETGHQLRPNPFGFINASGDNGTFIIEMTSDQCTNYKWLTLVELNLAYWDGQTEEAVFEKTLRCPPP